MSIGNIVITVSFQISVCIDAPNVNTHPSNGVCLSSRRFQRKMVLFAWPLPSVNSSGPMVATDGVVKLLLPFLLSVVSISRGWQATEEQSR